MVYGGKPSTGCKNCKKRKIKCDEATPACLQCTSTKRICPGYVQYFDLVFRDQTQSVKRKAERKRLKYKRSQSPDDSASTTSSSSEEIIVSAETSPVVIPVQPSNFIASGPDPGLGENPEQLALCQFFTNFVLLPSHPDAQCGFLHSLLPLYTSTSHDSLLSLATSAVALAISGGEPHRRSGYQLGRSILGMALRKTRMVLQDPILSIQDETLMAVMLMGFYDRINTAALGSKHSGSHDAGALALIQHREKQNHKSELSEKLVLAVNTQAVNSSFQYSGLSEKQSAWLVDLASKMPQNSASQLTTISAKAADLRGITRMVFSNLKGPASEHEINRILYLAIDIESQLETWAESVPKNWAWSPASGFNTPKELSRDFFVYENKMDYYYDLNVLDILNQYRAKRVMILSIIIECISHLGPPYDEFLSSHAKHAFRTTQELVDDLCGSVPYSLGTKTFGGAKDQPCTEYPYLGTAVFTKAQRRASAALGGWYLLENIKPCLSAAGLRPGQKKWLMQQMMRIGRVYYIRSPTVVLKDTLTDILQDTQGEDSARQEFIQAVYGPDICTFTEETDL